MSLRKKTPPSAMKGNGRRNIVSPVTSPSSFFRELHDVEEKTPDLSLSKMMEQDSDEDSIYIMGCVSVEQREVKRKTLLRKSRKSRVSRKLNSIENEPEEEEDEIYILGFSNFSSFSQEKRRDPFYNPSEASQKARDQLDIGKRLSRTLSAEDMAMAPTNSSDQHFDPKKGSTGGLRRKKINPDQSRGAAVLGGADRSFHAFSEDRRKRVGKASPNPKSPKSPFPVSPISSDEFGIQAFEMQAGIVLDREKGKEKKGGEGGEREKKRDDGGVGWGGGGGDIGALGSGAEQDKYLMQGIEIMAGFWDGEGGGGEQLQVDGVGWGGVSKRKGADNSSSSSSSSSSTSGEGGWKGPLSPRSKGKKRDSSSPKSPKSPKKLSSNVSPRLKRKESPFARREKERGKMGKSVDSAGGQTLSPERNSNSPL